MRERKPALIRHRDRTLAVSGTTSERKFVGGIVLALFLTAGYYKEAPFFSNLPFDVTLALGILLVPLIGSSFIRRLGRSPTGLFAPLVFFALLIPAALETGGGTYAQEKLFATFTLTFLATIAPGLILTTRNSFQALYHTIAGVGVALSALAIASPDSLALKYGRLHASNLDTITQGRISGVALVWIAILTLEKRVRIPVAFLLSIPVLISLVGSGSRGPLLASAVAFITVTFLSAGHLSRRFVRRVAVLCLIAIAATVGYQSAPDISRERIFKVGDSGEERLDLFQASLSVIAQHPAGVGLGNWAAAAASTGKVSPSVAEQDRYPHNIILEVLAEAGWLAGIALLWFLGLAWKKARTDPTGIEGRGTFAFLIYFLISSLFSDDLVSARLLLAIAAAAIAWGAQAHPSQITESDGISDGQTITRNR